jgi:glucose uptake protein GlcU
MLPPAEQAHAAQKRAYWSRHALSTCLVLGACIAVSAYVRPVPASLLVGASLAGVVVSLAEPAADRGHGLLSLVLIVAGAALFAWSAHSAAWGKGPFLWAQGVATMFVGAMIARTAYDKLRAV